MQDKFMTLAELNELLGTCSVNAAQLEALCFFAHDKRVLKAEMFDEATWRKYRNAKLYLKSSLPDIRAAIGASMRDSCCELRLLGREITNAEQELVVGFGLSIYVRPGHTSVSLIYPNNSARVPFTTRPLHGAVRSALQCARAEEATAARAASS